MDKRIKRIEFIKCSNKHFGVIVNNRFEIWDDGIIYDCDGKDIPSYIFKLKDMLLGLDKETH